MITAAHRRPSPRRGVVAAASLVALLVGACSDGADEPSGTAGTASVATSAPADDGTGTDAPPSTSLPSLDGLALRLDVVASLGAVTDVAVHPATGTLWVAERAGGVVVLDPAGADEPRTVLDLGDEVSTAVERGLLGIAVHPDGAHLYLSWNDADGTTQLTEHAIGPDGAVDPGSRRTLLRVEQPFPNHNGGDLGFGPDGLLYLGLGDGGAAGDPLDTGQDPSDLLGSLLRIDPLGGTGDEPYGIPEDNPFADGGGAPEVWLHGARNPWRFSWDRATGDLWVADVGQGEWEEIDRLPAPDAGRGANLGWNEVEGLEPYEGGTRPDGAVDPVHVYDHADGRCSVTGGVVYRGEAIPALVGTYLFADFCVGSIRGLQLGADGSVGAEVDLGVGTDPGTLVGFGEDADGEVLVLTLSGDVLRLVPG